MSSRSIGGTVLLYIPTFPKIKKRKEVLKMNINVRVFAHGLFNTNKYFERKAFKCQPENIYHGKSITRSFIWNLQSRQVRMNSPFTPTPNYVHISHLNTVLRRSSSRNSRK